MSVVTNGDQLGVPWVPCELALISWVILDWTNVGLGFSFELLVVPEHKQMYDLSIKMCKENDTFEKCIMTYMNHIKSLEDEN